MEEYEIEKLQCINLDMANYFVEFCKSHDLLCYFCGGGCIGAVRHSGFIPWDDDLDFFMPRSDYERLKEIWRDSDRYTLSYPSENYNDRNIFMTLRDRTTTMIKPYQIDLDITHGVVMDIFPLDACPSGKWKRCWQLLWALVYQLYCAQMIPYNHGKLISLLGRLALAIVPMKKTRYCIWRFAERKMSKQLWENSEYITELCAGPRYMNIKYPKHIFENALWVEFDGREMPIPKGYDEYLTLAFGDYMTLPPVELRVSPHESFVDLSQSYIAYRGIKYMTAKARDRR